MAMPRPYRILHVVTRMGFGGLEVEILNLVRGLERRGFEQAVSCLEGAGELADQIPADIPLRACGEGNVSQRIPWRAARYIRDWQPDIIHVRNGWAWPDTVIAWILAGRPGRLIFSFHGWGQVERMPRRRAFLYRQLARMTPGLASISLETAQRFAEESGIPAGRFVVLDSGIDTERFQPPKTSRAGGRLILGCVSRLDPIKAHDLLIDACARLIGEGHDLELRLLGDGPSRGELERQVQERGIGDRVKFLGMRLDIPEQLREMDVFVLSTHREGRPISIMESLATGVPVIATRVGSVPGLIADGKTGFLVEPDDVEGLTRAIRRLVEDHELRGRCSEEARRFAVAELSVERMADQYAAYYREIAGWGETAANKSLPAGDVAAGFDLE